MTLRSLVALLVIAQLVLAGAIYRSVDAASARATRRTAEEQLSLLSDTLRSTIDRFVVLPKIARESRSLAAVLLKPQDESARAAANIFLEKSAAAAGLAALYVLDANGLALAASNWREPTSFVGHSYAFRPYFSAAIAEGHARYYGVGVTTGLPGYFVSSRVTLAEGVSGVIVAKVDFSPLQASWSAGGEQVLVADGDGIVFLATDPALLYRPLQALEASRAAAIKHEQRYAAFGIGAALMTRDWPRGAIAGTPWQIIVVTPATAAWAPAGAAALAVLTGLVLALAVATQRQRRARLDAERAAFMALEARVRARTQDLAHALGQLELEIAERQRIDGELHRARDDLVQAAKLAAMGQAFAGLAHEVNQPLAALRTYLSSLRLMIGGQDHPIVTLEVFEQAGIARLSVTDSGPGLPESQRMRLFEPFFTTKPDGVGLGLAISYAIVHDHGGTLDYERTSTGETRFLLSLPLAPAPAGPTTTAEVP